MFKYVPFDALTKFSGTVHAIGSMNNIFSFINYGMQNCHYGFFLIIQKIITFFPSLGQL